MDDILAGHRVNGQQDLIAVHKFVDVGKFLHQFVIDMQAAGRIDKHGVIALFGRILHAQPDCFKGIGTGPLREDLHADLVPQGLELLYRCRTDDVRRDQHHLTVELLLADAGDLGHAGGFAGALQTDQHDGRNAFFLEVQAGLFGAEQFNDLVMNDLDEHLARFHAVEDVLAAGPLPDILQEFLDNLVVDIRLKQRNPHFLEHVLHILVGQPALAGYVTQCLAQTFA